MHGQLQLEMHGLPESLSLADASPSSGTGTDSQRHAVKSLC